MPEIRCAQPVQQRRCRSRAPPARKRHRHRRALRHLLRHRRPHRPGRRPGTTPPRWARCEDRIRCTKDTRLRSLPLHGFDQNQIRIELVAMACELTAWMQMLALDGPARARDHKRLRGRLLTAAGPLVRGGRRLRLRLATWPPRPPRAGPRPADQPEPPPPAGKETRGPPPTGATAGRQARPDDNNRPPPQPDSSRSRSIEASAVQRTPTPSRTPPRQPALHGSPPPSRGWPVALARSADPSAARPG